VLRTTELAGFIGAGLAGAAYVPPIVHLIREHCSAGLSRAAFTVWLAASLLVTTHAVAIGASVFIALGAIQLAATTLILIYTIKDANSYCSSHLPAILVAESTGGGRPGAVGVAVPDEQSSPHADAVAVSTLPAPTSGRRRDRELRRRVLLVGGWTPTRGRALHD